MGGHDEVDFQICGLGLLQNGLDALQTGDHTHLVQVGHDTGGTVGQHRLRKGPDGQRRALGVNMSIQEAGGQILSAGVHHTGVLAHAVGHVAHGGNGISADGHSAVIDLTGVHIDDLAVLDDQVSGLEPLGDSEQVLIHNVPPILFQSLSGSLLYHQRRLIP